MDKCRAFSLLPVKNRKKRQQQTGMKFTRLSSQDQSYIHKHLESGEGPRCGETGSMETTIDTMRKWKLEVLIVELSDVRATTFVVGNGLDFDYLDRSRSGTMTSSHFTIELCDCTFLGQIAILFVHIVSTRSRIIADPDAVVLNSERFSRVELKGAKINKPRSKRIRWDNVRTE